MLNRLSIRQRMSLIALLPLAGLVLLAAYNLVRLYENSLALDDAAEIVALSPSIGQMVYGLQRERDLSGAIAAADIPDANLVALLNTQKPLTDAAAVAFRQSLQRFQIRTSRSRRNSSDRAALDELLNETARLSGEHDALRILTARPDANGRQVIKAYDVHIGQSYEVLQSMFKSSWDPEITQRFLRLAALVYARNQASMERAMGAAIVARGAYSSRELVMFFRLRGQQGALFTMADWANPVDVPTVEDLTDIFGDGKLGPMRRELYADIRDLDKLSYDAADWFRAATPRIRLLDRLKRDTVIEMSEYVSGEQAKLRGHAATYLIVLGGFLSVIFMLLRHLLGSIGKSLSAAQASINAMATGNLSASPDLTSEAIEFRQLDAAMNALHAAEIARQTAETDARKSEAVTKKAQQAERERERADHKTEKERVEYMNKEILEFEKRAGEMMCMLEDAALELEVTARGLAQIADDTREEAHVTRHASDDASVHVQAVAKASEGLATSLSVIRTSIDEASGKASNAADDAAKAKRRADDLSGLAGQIDIVVSVIDDIAAKTNFLALNATIEAAMAGTKQGGFGIIAHELKELTKQTAARAFEINALVDSAKDISTTISEGISFLEITARDNSANTATLAKTIADHGGAAEEMNLSMRAASDASQSVVGAAERVSAISDETRSMSGELLTAAESVTKTGAEFRDVYEEFVSRIRAA